MPHILEINETDYFLGKCKLLKFSKGIEEFNNPVADEEIEKNCWIVEDIPFKRARYFYKTLK